MGKLDFKGYWDQVDMEENKGNPIPLRVTIVGEDGTEVVGVQECLRVNKRELILRKKEEK